MTPCFFLFWCFKPSLYLPLHFEEMIFPLVLRMCLLPLQKSKKLLAMKEEGNMAFRQGRMEEAHHLYSEALTVDPLNTLTNAKLHCNRALVGSKVNHRASAQSEREHLFFLSSLPSTSFCPLYIYLSLTHPFFILPLLLSFSLPSPSVLSLTFTPLNRALSRRSFSAITLLHSSNSG